MPTGCVHGTDWYVRQLGVRLLAWMGARPTEPLTGLLAEGITEHFAGRVRYVGRQRELRNRPDGYWITSADPAAAGQAYTGMPDGARWPRAKRHDDAAIIYISSPELAWRTV